jgi:hypothetical protein
MQQQIQLMNPDLLVRLTNQSSTTEPELARLHRCCLAPQNRHLTEIRQYHGTKCMVVLRAFLGSLSQGV